MQWQFCTSCVEVFWVLRKVSSPTDSGLGILRFFISCKPNFLQKGARNQSEETVMEFRWNKRHSNHSKVGRDFSHHLAMAQHLLHKWESSEPEEWPAVHGPHAINQTLQHWPVSGHKPVMGLLTVRLPRKLSSSFQEDPLLQLRKSFFLMLYSFPWITTP